MADPKDKPAPAPDAKLEGPMISEPGEVEFLGHPEWEEVDDPDHQPKE